MREVTLFWKRHRLALNRAAIAADIFEKIVFLGYLERTPEVVVTIMRGVCNEGHTPHDLDQHDDYEVVDILAEPTPLDSAWIFSLKISHPLTMLAAKVGQLTVKPGSCLNQEGLHYTLRGTALSINIVRTAARMMLKPDYVKVTQISQIDFKGNQVLTDQQMLVIKTAFDMGWYEIPRKVKIAEIADVVGLSRAATSEHLIRAEGTIVKYFLYGDPELNDEDDFSVRK